MKSIKKWLEDLPEPYRTQALANANKALSHNTYSDGGSALTNAFLYENTKEGADFWHNVEGFFRNLNDLPILAIPEPLQISTSPTCAIEALMTIALKKGFDVQDITGVWQKDEEWKYKLKDNRQVFTINLKTDTND